MYMGVEREREREMLPGRFKREVYYTLGGVDKGCNKVRVVPVQYSKPLF